MPPPDPDPAPVESNFVPLSPSAKAAWRQVFGHMGMAVVAAALTGGLYAATLSAQALEVQGALGVCIGWAAYGNFLAAIIFAPSLFIGLFLRPRAGKILWQRGWTIATALAVFGLFAFVFTGPEFQSEYNSGWGDVIFVSGPLPILVLVHLTLVRRLTSRKSAHP